MLWCTGQCWPIDLIWRRSYGSGRRTPYAWLSLSAMCGITSQRIGAGIQIWWSDFENPQCTSVHFYTYNIMGDWIMFWRMWSHNIQSSVPNYICYSLGRESVIMLFNFLKFRFTMVFSRVFFTPQTQYILEISITTGLSTGGLWMEVKQLSINFITAKIYLV